MPRRVSELRYKSHGLSSSCGISDLRTSVPPLTQSESAIGGRLEEGAMSIYILPPRRFHGSSFLLFSLLCFDESEMVGLDGI